MNKQWDGKKYSLILNQVIFFFLQIPLTKFKRTLCTNYFQLSAESVLFVFSENTPPDASFTGSMQLLAGVKLCTDRHITNHPHYENKFLRERTKQVTMKIPLYYPLWIEQIPNFRNLLVISDHLIRGEGGEEWARGASWGWCPSKDYRCLARKGGASIAAVNGGGKGREVNPQLVVSTALERSRRKVDNWSIQFIVWGYSYRVSCLSLIVNPCSSQLDIVCAHSHIINKRTRRKLTLVFPDVVEAMFSNSFKEWFLFELLWNRGDEKKPQNFSCLNIIVLMQ